MNGSIIHSNIFRFQMSIYFDNASTTPLLPEVKEAMKSVIDNCYGNPSSIHLHGRKARIIVEEARKIIAQGLNASTGEIFFTSGATEANNMAFLASVRDLDVKRIISTNVEHHCISHMLDHLHNTRGIEVNLLQVNTQGHIDLEELERLLATGNTKTLVSVMHVNNELGTITDLDAVSEICKTYDALFHSDTAQSIGKLALDVQETSINFLCGASHKFFGPKGVGFIYINGDNLIKPLFHGGDQERGMRSGTENIYGIAGMSKAFELALSELEARKLKVGSIKDHFTKRLKSELDDIKINGSENSLYNILSVSFPESPKSEMLMMNLDIMGISASGGSACSSGVENDSHVLQAIGHDPKRKTVRFSFSHFNTIEEVDTVVEKLKSISAVAV